MNKETTTSALIMLWFAFAALTAFLQRGWLPIVIFGVIVAVAVLVVEWLDEKKPERIGQNEE